MEQRLVDVAIERAVGDLDRLWSYRAGPEGPQDWVGHRIEVPLGRGTATGVVLREQPMPLQFATDPKIRSVLAVLDDEPTLTPQLTELALWMSERYLAFIGQTVRAMIPPGVRQGAHGLESPPARWRAGERSPGPRAVHQRAMWEWLREHGPSTREEMLAAGSASSAVFVALRRQGLIVPVNEVQELPQKPAVQLNAEQRDAVQRLSGASGVWLLEGVTGSGKTEVYMERIEKTLADGRQAMVLVPEIALTPQTVARFRERFGSRVEVWHSGLSRGQRAETWRRVRRGTTPVVVGARSAIFLPFPCLGLIVLDEEHETTYKQDEHPRYHAREVAEERARREGAQCILGSATPALDSAWRARNGQIGWIRLTERVMQRPLPQVTIVDMRAELRNGNHEMFSGALMEAVTQTLAAGRQTILFLNRRGYATYIFCRDCGASLSCPHCSVTLTYHQETGRLSCHYCFYETVPPRRCPRCASERIRYFGAGTERVVEAVARLWPQARVLRADRDTLSGRESHERMWRAFSRREADILVGTQMIAKGMDWPMVTLVGILAADVSLNFPDFRSGERTFQLLVQASGRAGRGQIPGHVVIQTYNPEHYAIVRAVQADYQGFLDEELQYREAAGYPPFRQLWLLEIRDRDEHKAREMAQETADLVRSQVDGAVAVLGPAPAPIAKVREFFRFHILLKSAVRGAQLDRLGAVLKGRSGVQVTIDPYFML